MNPLALLEKAINEHGSSTILKERLVIVKEQLAKVEKEKEELKKNLEEAYEEIRTIKLLIPNQKFIEYRGVKFKRKPSGGFEESVYCPKCEVGMATTGSGSMPYVCGRCHSLSGFKSRELPKILDEIKTEFP